MPIQIIIVAGTLLVLAAAGTYIMRRVARSRQARDTAAYQAARARELHLPVSLHPVIDPDICIGSLACVRSCPEGDILGIVDGTARLIEGARCVGHGRCEAECPVGAIKLVFGTQERGVDLPHLSTVFETSRPGVHAVGELGGMGLIKNAMAQGVQVVEHLKRTVKPGAGGGTDIVIVGAGPAGLATAAACRHAGLSFRLFEQGSLGGTVANYPRQKMIVSSPVDVPGYGRIGKKTMSKEEVLDTFRGIVDHAGFVVEEGIRVEGLEGALGKFTVRTSEGWCETQRVVLAVGRRGTPKRLGVPGEDQKKVTYNLTDPDQYQGSRVLVVGGGDSALETALMLADDTDAEVTLSYRGTAFNRCRPDNRVRFEGLVESGRIKAVMRSNVTVIGEKAVVLDAAGETVRLDNDYVIVQIGGQLPTGLLDQMRIQVKRHHGEDRGVSTRQGEAELEKGSSRLALILFGIGTLILAGLTIVGWRYYLTPVDLRTASPLDAALKPSGWWGHGVGIVATLFMMMNFLYAARKRLRWLNFGKIRDWLTFHMFVGFMAPLVIAFHAAFQSRNMLATVTALALGIVVMTGVIGRFIWGLVPTTQGKAVELATLRSRWERHRGRITRLMAESTSRLEARSLFAWATVDPPESGSLVRHLASLPGTYLRARRGLLGARHLFTDPQHYKDFKASYYRLLGMRTQVGFHKSLKRLMGSWRILHVVLAVLMVFVIAAHIAVSLYIGYTWIFH